MPLPIPNILENAANVLHAAKKIEYNPTNEEISKLKHLAKLVSPDDLQAVMNEIGQVYMGINNIQVTQIGSSPDVINKALQIVLVVNFGMSDRQLIVPLPMDNATAFVKGINECMTALQVSSGGLITDTGAIGGQP